MPQLTDTALDEVVRKCSQQFPHWGVVMQHGHFKSQGINVPLIRLYEANRRVDPEGLCFRLRKVLKRRVYNVPGPQKLWHLDGNEKLKMWGIYIHGCIDGYSRFPLHIKVSTNKRSTTVLNFFLESIHKYGIPSRVRVDKV
uniref:Integrase catalytic domain-containing protein n=1 Tax=Strigamia maritima TaxID=126957 RepID=T1IHC8_STRMM